MATTIEPDFEPDREQVREQIALLEQLLLKEEDLKRSIDENNRDIRNLEQGDHISRLLKVATEFNEIFKDLYGVDSPDDLLDARTARAILRYGSHSISVRAKEKIKSGAGFFSKDELDLSGLDTQEIKDKILLSARTELNNNKAELRDVEEKLKGFAHE